MCSTMCSVALPSPAAPSDPKPLFNYQLRYLGNSCLLVRWPVGEP